MLCAEVATLGQNLKNRRGKTATQEEIAAAVGASQSDVSKWERDVAYPPVPTLIAFAKIWGCSVEELLRGVDHAYDQIVIKQRDLSGHTRKGDSALHNGGSIVPGASSASTRIQHLEQQLRERDRFISQVENAAIKVVRLFTTTEENRRPRTHQPGRRGARRKAG